MTEFFLIYLFTVVHTLSIIFNTMIVVIVGSFLALAASKGMDGELRDKEDRREFFEPAKSRLKKYSVPLLMMISFSVLVPTYKSMSLIIGGGLVWNGANNFASIDGSSELPGNFVKAANRFLEKLNE